ncbi:hypothetical protein EDF81_1130 [Enterobacter sp. BIGb0383]|uniref:DUF5951 family protein n=1 Tax=unclassified Enterobacter TaxID=2608935 RepID=UPI000FAFFA16|nr:MULTISPECIES: DUF5951 family protein [unclassified Enterobacter]ROP62629.1 hypothetical protein EDF81_1130 [Enterobacter sp. BIGb0383]ROS12790.1 hypothetical protein EC848_1133 [Enterobacter sp. BIGb0359]
MEAYLSGEIFFVKPQLHRAISSAASVNNLLYLPAIFVEKYFAGLGFLHHHLKSSFNFFN